MGFTDRLRYAPFIIRRKFALFGNRTVKLTLQEIQQAVRIERKKTLLKVGQWFPDRFKGLAIIFIPNQLGFGIE